VFKAFGRNNMEAIHYSLTAVVVIALLVYSLGCLQGGRVTGLLAMGLFSLLSCVGTHATDLMAFHTEWPLVMCTSAAMLILLYGLRAGRPGLVLLSGLFLGVAFLSKQVGLCDLGAASVFCVLYSRTRESYWKSSVIAVVPLVAGAAVPVLVTVGWFAFNGAMADFWYYFWQYNTEINMRSVTLAMQMRALVDLWRELVTSGLAAVAILAVAGAVLGWVGLVKHLRSGGRMPPSEVVLFTGWFVTSWVGASYSTRGFGHYFITTFPPLSLLAAVAAVTFARFISGRVGAGRPHPRGHFGLSGVLRTSLVTLTATAVGLHCVYLLATQFSWGGGGWGEDYRSWSRYIAAESAPDDTIFLWGFVPEIYTLSDRLHASRFVYCNQVTGLIPWTNLQVPDTSSTAVPGAFEIMMEELAAHRPIFIVDASIGALFGYSKYPISMYPEFDRFVREGYREVGVGTDHEGKPSMRLLRRID